MKAKYNPMQVDDTLMVNQAKIGDALRILGRFNAKMPRFNKTIEREWIATQEVVLATLRELVKTTDELTEKGE